MRGFAVWALWAALGLLLVDAGLEVRNERDRERTPSQQQTVPDGTVDSMDGGDGTPTLPPPVKF